MEFIISLFSSPAILLGMVALFGLVAQKKSGTEVMTGTFKTIIGFLVFNLGGTTITNTLQSFNVLFQEGFNISGIVAAPEAATALAQENYGFVVACILILGFGMNLVFARLTPFKNIFFHGGHSLFFACVLTLIVKSFGYGDMFTIVFSGVLLGFLASFLPELVQPFMRKVTGSDSAALGHYNLIAYGLAGWIGCLFSKYKDQSTEAIKFPKWLSFFRDFLMGMAVIMLILFYVAAIAAGREATEALAGSTHWLVFPLMQAFTFTAGMSILMTGVRMFLAEITAAFVAISDKYIPNARPALDVPTIFPFAPTAVTVGFVSAYAAGLLAAFLMVWFNSPVVIIPAAHIAFFSGGAAAIFGNSTGGWRGAIAGAFVAGLLLAFLPLALYPIYAQMGVEGSTFPNVDMNVIGILLEKLFSFFH